MILLENLYTREVVNLPNIKSSKKRVTVNQLKTDRNRAAKTALKTKIKKFDAAIAGGAPAAQESYVAAVAGIDKAAVKGVLHKNTAARKKSALAKKLNAAKE